MKLLVIVFMTFILLSCIKIDEYQSIKSSFSKNKLLSDFDRLYDVILSGHPLPFTDTNELEILYTTQRKKIKRMSKYDFIQIIAPVVSKVNCGHTFLKLSFDKNDKILSKAKFIPMHVKIIGNTMYAMKDSTNNYLIEGSRIHSINSTNVSTIISNMYNSISSDGQNITYKEKLLNRGLKFNYLYYFHIESSEEYIIEYSLPGKTQVENVTLNAISYEDLISKYKNNIYIEKKRPEFKYDFIDEYALLKIPHFIYYDSRKFKVYEEKIKTFFSEVDNKNITNLILDLRGNISGDPKAANLLLTYILKDPYQYFSSRTQYYPKLVKDSEIKYNSFKGNLYTLIDGECVSTTGHILSIIKDQNRGTLIGQESGAGYLCSDASKEVTLNNTGIILRYATSSASTNVKDQSLGRGILPEINFKYSINDYLNNADLEMEYAINKIRDRKSRS